MTDVSRKIPTLCKIQCTCGDLANAWLFQFDVSKGGAPYRVQNWEDIEKCQHLYTFHLKFLSDASAALAIRDLSIAQAMQRILKTTGIDATIRQY
jgi:hypothetical protein